MTEDKIDAKPISGQKAVSITVESSKPLQAGGLEEKREIEGKVTSSSGKERHISLVERIFETEEGKGHYIETWKAFKQVGLPVVDTVREGPNNSLLITNLKADGSELYGKGLRDMLRYLESGEVPRKRHPLDSAFLSLTAPKNLPEIEEEVNRLVRIANENNIRLPWDDAFELKIASDGSWSLIILDLTYGKAVGPKFNPSHKPGLKKRNSRAAKGFLSTLREIREDLSK